MKQTIKRTSFLIFLLVVVLSAACSTGSVEVPPPTATPVTPEAQEDPAAAQVTATEADSASQSPVQVATESKPVPRAGLAATDPTSVNLASGEPVLVEFFAFW